MLSPPGGRRGAPIIRRWRGLLAALVAAAPLGAPPLVASAQTPSQAMACGYALSAPILSEWRGLGGESGRLGCPTAAEAKASTSPQGSQAREATFGGGTILWHASGPRAGQAFAVVACYRLYFQFGGPSGWLGLPISDAVNTPDGQRQSFEGGSLTAMRATDDCDATRGALAAAATAAAPVASKTPLDLFHDPAGADYVTAASQSAVTRLLAAHYQRMDTEAYVFADQVPGTQPLKLYWNEARDAHQTVATAQGERDALAAGDIFDGVQGFVWTQPMASSRPLKQFRNPASGRALLVATPQGEADAAAQGFTFVRIEGYAPAEP